MKSLPYLLFCVCASPGGLESQGRVPEQCGGSGYLGRFAAGGPISELKEPQGHSQSASRLSLSLSQIFQKFEVNQYQLGKAAREAGCGMDL